MRKYPLSLLKDKNIVTFFDFWEKNRRGEKEGGDDYHLLCWHSRNVTGIKGKLTDFASFYFTQLSYGAYMGHFQIVFC